MYEILITIYIDESLFKEIGIRKRKDFGFELRAACSDTAHIPLLNVGVQWITLQDSQNVPKITFDVEVRTEQSAGLRKLNSSLALQISSSVMESPSIPSGTKYHVVTYIGGRCWQFTKESSA